MEYEIGPDERTSTAVVRAVSAVVGRERASLRPLDEVVDPEALDGLFDRRADGGARTGGRVSFVYCGCWVVVESGEYIRLEGIEPPLVGDRPETAVPDPP